MTHLIKVYHNYDKGVQSMKAFLDDVNQTLKNSDVILGLHYRDGEIMYSLDTKKMTYPSFESQFYTHFNNFQLTEDDRNVRKYDPKKTSIAEISLMHNWFYPFKTVESDNSDFISTLFRSFENFDLIHDRCSVFFHIKPITSESLKFFLSSKIQYKLFKWKLSAQFYKYLFKTSGMKNRKQIGHDFYKKKIREQLFDVSIGIVAQAESKIAAKGKIKAMFNNFEVFRQYPLNQFELRYHTDMKILSQLRQYKTPFRKHMMTGHELSSLFHFPQNPKQETSLLTVKSKKLALPVGIPTLPPSKNEKGEIIADAQPGMNIVGVSDYRSIKVPIGVYDEDRLRHTYVVGKTGVGKSKFLLSLMINDIKLGKGMGVIDPHGDAIEEIMAHIPPERVKDVIIFDPTDEEFPFCFNPLDIKGSESKQVLAKGFIDIFKKFFGANWNAKLEHVLRMIFLALLDKEGSTLFDIIRALTDKDFRYDMIDAIDDDVVRNFWTNEFAGRSQQFNTEAIMPILNKVGQLLSIDMLRNIFASPENKLDFREMMDESKILLVKLPKGKLQEEIMGFLGAMFVTKIFQTSMGRQELEKKDRVPFFLYVDEFQNFATDTFNEILSEARKYGLGLVVAHQFIRQIPENISTALFGNVGTLISFRISSDDAGYMKEHFSPFVDSYDLANLNIREFYCKLLVQGQVKDPFSLKAMYLEDAHPTDAFMKSLFDHSRSTYARTKEEAKTVVEEQKDVVEKIEEFAEPLI